jgi:hypothetical protein
LHKNYIKIYGTQPETLIGIYTNLASPGGKFSSPFFLILEIKSTHMASVGTRRNYLQWHDSSISSINIIFEYPAALNPRDIRPYSENTRKKRGQTWTPQKENYAGRRESFVPK